MFYFSNYSQYVVLAISNVLLFQMYCYFKCIAPNSIVSKSWHSFLIHFSSKWHEDCFKLLEMVLKWNFHNMSWTCIWMSLLYMPRSESTGSGLGISFLLRTPILFPWKVAADPTLIKSILFLNNLQTIVMHLPNVCKPERSKV